MSDDSPGYDAKALLKRASEIGFRALRDEIEGAVILAAMEAAHNNGAHAADLLKVRRTTLSMQRVRLGLPMHTAGRPEVKL